MGGVEGDNLPAMDETEGRDKKGGILPFTGEESRLFICWEGRLRLFYARFRVFESCHVGHVILLTLRGKIPLQPEVILPDFRGVYRLARMMK
jgi:hypothetical protein